MLIYNVTIKIEWNISAAWLAWMKTEHIPEVMSTQCFDRFQMVKVIQTEETDGPTYAVQYYANGYPQYNKYIEDFAPALREKTIQKWGNQFIAFRSLMEIEI